MPIAGGPEKPPSAVVRSFDAARSISVQRQASGSPGKSDIFESQHWHGSRLLMIMTRTENTSPGPYLDTFTSVLTSSVLSWVSTRLAGWLTFFKPGAGPGGQASACVPPHRLRFERRMLILNKRVFSAASFSSLEEPTSVKTAQASSGGERERDRRRYTSRVYLLPSMAEMLLYTLPTSYGSAEYAARSLLLLD